MSVQVSSAIHPTMFQCALLILEDECPPDPRMYFCCHGEDPETACIECWRHYLDYLLSGHCRYHAYDASLE